MSNLSMDEKIQLEEILTGYFNGLQQPGEGLKALINISGVQIDITTIDYKLPVKELVTNFYSLILKKPEDLESFLIYLQNKLDPDVGLTIEGYIEKLKRSRIKQNSNYRQIMSEKRQQNHEKPTSKTGIRINNDIIVKYDLDELVYKFRKALDYQGVFAFSLGEEYTILNNYIIKRILHELQEKTQRDYWSREIRLSRNLKSIDDDLKNNNINQITDLLAETDPLDVVLIIWNYNINKKNLNSMTDIFLSEIKTKCNCYLENKSRCLIIIFANVKIKQSIQGCINLSIPKSFQINELCDWFRGYLQNLQIQDDMINTCLRKLRNADGHLLSTYNTLEVIIDKLRGIN